MFLLGQHLNYKAVGRASIIVNHVRAAAIGPNTYFEVFGWNPGREGGGYCGIQQTKVKNFIFSIWDPSNHEKITTKFEAKSSTSGAFGGEGTGLHWDNQASGDSWKVGNWYTFVARRWDVEKHSYFGLWTRDEKSGVWTHQVTMDFPMPDVWFDTGLNSFLEIFWKGSEDVYRRVDFRDPWAFTVANGWVSLDQARHDGVAKPGNQDSGGVENNAYFLRAGKGYASGGRTPVAMKAPVAKSPTTERANARLVAKVDDKMKEISLSWRTDSKKSPQFGYSLEIIDQGDPKKKDISAAGLSAPDVYSLPPLKLSAGNYRARLVLTDIFGAESEPIWTSFSVKK